MELPTYPRVFSLGKLVVIEYEDGKQLSWGIEGSEYEAINVAEEMDIELKIHTYLKNAINEYIETILTQIIGLAPEEEINALLEEVLRMKIRALQKDSGLKDIDTHSAVRDVKVHI